MKTLLLLRHGKSSWKSSDLPDHDRPLKKRGRKAAERMGRLLQELDLMPEHIFTSSAIRAIETTQLVIQGSRYYRTVDVASALYHAEPDMLAGVVARSPSHAERVLVVGHNPGLADWLKLLTGQELEFPTAALALINVPVNSWSELTVETRGLLQGLWRPRQLPRRS
jgi:phosphohistidine phosphatase